MAGRMPQARPVTGDRRAATTTSLGFRTDLMLLTLQGSAAEARDGYLVVLTPANLTPHWGKRLIRARPAGSGVWAAWQQ
ncbi:hypothetical protein GCM10017788_11660 [Amycolatopsis acidiphila]|nr:hypothetical protein GCM10017788_11660 [Amycolatopsis acidiphila]